MYNQMMYCLRVQTWQYSWPPAHIKPILHCKCHTPMPTVHKLTVILLSFAYYLENLAGLLLVLKSNAGIKKSQWYHLTHLQMKKYGWLAAIFFNFTHEFEYLRHRAMHDKMNQIVCNFGHLRNWDTLLRIVRWIRWHFPQSTGVKNCALASTCIFNYCIIHVPGIWKLHVIAITVAADQPFLARLLILI